MTPGALTGNDIAALHPICCGEAGTPRSGAPFPGAGVQGHHLPARSTPEEPRPHRRQPPVLLLQACSSYFTFTQTPPMTGTTLLYPGTTAGIVMPVAKRLFAVVHWASSANDTVVTECETPPPGLAFTTALKIINNHIPSPHDTVCSLPAPGTICYPYRVGAASVLGG
jgi:hypothetical protein